MPDLEAQLAIKELQLIELRALFLNSCERLGAVCSALGLRADEPAVKLEAGARHLARTHRALLAAADDACTCAHPAGTGHWYILNPQLIALQAQVDHSHKPKSSEF